MPLFDFLFFEIVYAGSLKALFLCVLPFWYQIRLIQFN